MVVNIGRIPPWPRRRGSAARPRRSAAAAGLIALLAASVPPLAAAASSSSTGVLSAWAATRNAANLPIPASRLDLLAQDEEGEEMMGDDATPKVSIYSTDMELGEVPDMPLFTPLSPADRALPQYDEADLKAADVLAEAQAVVGDQGAVAWADGVDPAWRFVRVKGTQFTAQDNDAPWYFIGTNLWYGMNLASKGARGDRRRLLAELDALKQLGITHVRILGASEGPDTEPWRVSPSLMPCPGKYNRDLLDGFDFLIYALGDRRIRATVVMGNEWPWSGGFAQLVKWSELIKGNGGKLPSPSQVGAPGFDQCGFPLASEVVGPATTAGLRAATVAAGVVITPMAGTATALNSTAARLAASAAALRQAGGRKLEQNEDRTTILVRKRTPPAAVVAAASVPAVGSPPPPAAAARAQQQQQPQVLPTAPAARVVISGGGGGGGGSNNRAAAAAAAPAPAAARAAAPAAAAANATAPPPSGPTSGPGLKNAFWRHRGFQKGGIPYPGPGQHSWSQWQDYAGLFFTNQVAQKLWSDHVAFLTSHVNPYTGVAHNRDPTIMAWQVANEPRMRHDGWAVRVDDFRAFISNASAILKAAAPKQLTCNGMEGDTAWFSRGQATVLSQYDSKIDFVTSHVWPMNWKWFGPRTDEEEGAQHQRAVGMVRQYVRASTAQASALGKPLLLEEFGFPRDGGSLNPNATTTGRDMMYAAIFKEVIASANTMGVLAGAEFWAWAGAGRPTGYEARSSNKERWCRKAPMVEEDVCAAPPPGLLTMTGKPAKWAGCYFAEDSRPESCPIHTWWSPLGATDFGGQTGWLGDPPHESQGWYSVYDSDLTTTELIFNATALLSQSQGCAWGSVGTSFTVERERETSLGYIATPGAMCRPSKSSCGGACVLIPPGASSSSSSIPPPQAACTAQLRPPLPRRLPPLCPASGEELEHDAAPKPKKKPPPKKHNNTAAVEAVAAKLATVVNAAVQTGETDAPKATAAPAPAATKNASSPAAAAAPAAVMVNGAKGPNGAAAPSQTAAARAPAPSASAENAKAPAPSSVNAALSPARAADAAPGVQAAAPAPRAPKPSSSNGYPPPVVPTAAAPAPAASPPRAPKPASAPAGSTRPVPAAAAPLPAAPKAPKPAAAPPKVMPSPMMPEEEDEEVLASAPSASRALGTGAEEAEEEDLAAFSMSPEQIRSAVEEEEELELASAPSAAPGSADENTTEEPEEKEKAEAALLEEMEEDI